jgi:hypothetical protein
MFPHTEIEVRVLTIIIRDLSSFVFWRQLRLPREKERGKAVYFFINLIGQN